MPSPNTLRILVTASWIPGGVTVWTHEFANELAARGHQVLCLFVQPRGLFLNPSPTFHGARYQAVWVSAAPPGFLSAVPHHLATSLWAQGVDVIVSTGPEGTRIPGTFAAHRHPPHIGVVHVPEPRWISVRGLSQGALGAVWSLLMRLAGRTDRVDTASALAPWYWQWVHYLESKRLRGADVVVCVSHVQRRMVHHAWGILPGRTHVLYNGIDTVKFQPGASPVQSRGPRLLFVGGTNPRKGGDLALEALATVCKERPDASLDLVGGWNWTVYKERARRLGVTSKVRFHPYVGYEEMPSHYARACALVAPTRAESFGRAQAEAMACGLPVLSTRTGAVPEIVQHGVTGLLVPPDNVEALAQAILTVLADRGAAAALGENGRAWVIANCGWGLIMQGWEELLRRMVARDEAAAGHEAAV